LAKRLHVGFGHFRVGYMDGVNMVMLRNVKGLLELVPDIKITLFGRLNRNIQNFLEPIPGRLEYIDIEEFDPDSRVEGFKGRDIQEQHVQDYIWYGSNIADSLIDRLSDLDVVIMENLGIGIHPPLTYAFYQVIRDCNFLAREKRFYYRTHDFVKERQRNFANLKKFHDSPTRNVPDWHEMVYPDFENLHYITINSSDIDRLMEHGISRKQIVYLPNSLGNNMLYDDNEYLNLRNRLVEDKGLDSDVKFLFYPVRCIRRNAGAQTVQIDAACSPDAGAILPVPGNDVFSGPLTLVHKRPNFLPVHVENLQTHVRSVRFRRDGVGNIGRRIERIRVVLPKLKTLRRRTVCLFDPENLVTRIGERPVGKLRHPRYGDKIALRIGYAAGKLPSSAVVAE